MESDSERIIPLLKRLASAEGAATPLTEQEKGLLDEFRRRYPFYNIPHPGETGEPSLREVMTASSPEALARSRGEDTAGVDMDNFYPEHPADPTPSTNAAIDDFLNTYGHQSPEEDELLERLIFNPIPDYAQQLAREEQPTGAPLPAASPAATSSTSSQDALIDRFLQSYPAAAETSPTPPASAVSSPEVSHPKSPVSSSQASSPSLSSSPSLPPTPARPAAQKGSTPPPDSLLSESLAKIYIKTRRYAQAYEILNGLSLRFPEKSRYFADQLRFLQKLIINERRKQQENQTGAAGDMAENKSEI